MLFQGHKECCYRQRTSRMLCFENGHSGKLIWDSRVASHSFKTGKLLNYWQFPSISYGHPRMQRVISVMLEKNQTWAKWNWSVTQKHSVPCQRLRLTLPFITEASGHNEISKRHLQKCPYYFFLTYFVFSNKSHSVKVNFTASSNVEKKERSTMKISLSLFGLQNTIL